MELKEATALITGGTAGIGRGIAAMLVASGAKVAVTGRDQRKLDRAARELGVHAIRADVSKEDDVKRTMDEALAALGHLDILVNNAGVGAFKPIVEMDRTTFERVLATNVTGPMMMAREAAKHFVSRRRGNIVNIGSTVALRGGANGTAYHASKFALRGMTECWRAELRQHNVRVFLINPSEVISDFFATSGRAQADDPTKLHAEDIAHMVKAVLEMPDRGFTTELTVFATNPID